MVFPATLDSYARIRDFFLKVMEDLSVSEENFLDVEIALEEILVNVFRYAYQGYGQGDVELECALVDDDKIAFTIKDWGRPFNPLEVAEPVTPHSLEEAKIGGLGISFVRRLTEGFDYSREGDANILTLTFRKK